jgi:hypothetical protein
MTSSKKTKEKITVKRWFRFCVRKEVRDLKNKKVWRRQKKIINNLKNGKVQRKKPAKPQQK